MSFALNAYIYDKKGGVYMNNKPHDSMADRIAAYNEEMLRYYHQAHGHDTPAEEAPSAGLASVPSEESAFESTVRPEKLSTPEMTEMTEEPEMSEESEIPETPVEPSAPAPEPYIDWAPSDTLKTERPWEDMDGTINEVAPTPNQRTDRAEPSPRPQTPLIPDMTPEQAVPPAYDGTRPLPDTEVPPSEEAPPFGNMPPESLPAEPSPNAGMQSSDLSDTAYLIVRVYSARGAIPIEGAVVTISRFTDNGEELLHLTVTDENGFTSQFPLPAASRELSQSPGNPNPFTLYNVQVDVDGYYTIRNENLPLYGGVTAVQGVSMVPLPEQGQNEIIVFPEYGPTNLN